MCRPRLTMPNSCWCLTLPFFRILHGVSVETLQPPPSNLQSSEVSLRTPTPSFLPPFLPYPEAPAPLYNPPVTSLSSDVPTRPRPGASRDPLKQDPHDPSTLPELVLLPHQYDPKPLRGDHRPDYLPFPSLIPSLWSVFVNPRVGPSEGKSHLPPTHYTPTIPISSLPSGTESRDSFLRVRRFPCGAGGSDPVVQRTELTRPDIPSLSDGGSRVVLLRSGSVPRGPFSGLRDPTTL